MLTAVLRQRAHTSTYTIFSLYMYIFYIVGWVDVQVKHNEADDGRESSIVFGMHTPSTKKRERHPLVSLRLKSNHARSKGRGMSHMCAHARTHSCTRAMHAHARAQIDGRVRRTRQTHVPS